MVLVLSELTAIGVTDYYLNTEIKFYQNPEGFLMRMMANKGVPIWHASAEMIPSYDFRPWQGVNKLLSCSNLILLGSLL